MTPTRLQPTKNPDAVPLATFSTLSADRPRSLIDHLQELRSRLLVCLAIAGVASIGGYALSDWALHHMALMAGPMVFLRPAEAFMVKLKVAVSLGLIFTMPFILYHAWRYIAIALKADERRIVLSALPASYLLFALGAALSWTVVAPAGLRYLVGLGNEDLRPALSVEAVFNFTLALAVGMGVLFQMPLGIVGLSWLGVVDPVHLRRYRRHAIVAILVLAGVITPGPDLVSQLLLAIPTYLLFELALLFASILSRRA